MDLWHKLTKFLDHYRATAIVCVAALLLAVGIVGCQVKADSLLEPGKKVSPTELSDEIVLLEAGFEHQRVTIEQAKLTLNTEIDAHNARVALRDEDIERQVELQERAVGILAGVGRMALGGSPWTAIAASLINVVVGGGAIGLAIDGRRKDKIIKANGNGNTT